MLLGVWIADRPGWKWFVGAAGGLAVFIAMLPDLIGQIVTGTKRFRSVSRR